MLETRLAVGGTSEVYLARADPRSGFPERLIVKRPLPQFQSDTAWKAMFSREARLQAAINHPNVVRVFDAGTVTTGEPYLAMEYVEGVDGDRLARRVRQVGERFDPALATYIAKEVLAALEAVHAASDELGRPLGILHRDVTPSNIYLSRSGEVKLGDFGLAHSQHKASFRSETGNTLKGKFAYLAPEQVAGDPVDHRADLFSLAVVLAELLLGRQLFDESGQLAVLLAIRDGRIDAVEELRGRVPDGLLAALLTGLSRIPRVRFSNARAFLNAIEPFAMPAPQAVRALAEKVRWVTTNPTGAAMPVVRIEGAGGLRNEPLGLEETQLKRRPRSVLEAKTILYSAEPSFAVLSTGEERGPLSFAELVEALATGEIGRGDRVDYMGQGFRLVEDMEDLVRFLPAKTERTQEVEGPGAPDFVDELSVSTVLAVLARVVRKKETGVLFAERAATAESGKAIRKELYFEGGKLHHVASSDASELLGEYLVRRGELARDELDMALAVLPRYDGRMGDTLIALGLVSGVNVFRAIREQGRDRVADLFRWTSGKLTYYVGQTHPRVEFSLKLDLAQLMLAGLEATTPAESPIAQYRLRLDQVLEPKGDPLGEYPPLLEHVRSIVTHPRPLREVLSVAAGLGVASNGDVLRADEVLVALGALSWT